MPEKEQPFKGPESVEQTPRPNLLDVVKIDGRWAQVVADGNWIKYLDDQNQIKINWDDFQRTKDWGGLPVWEVKESESFTPEELKRIHWGQEQVQHPHLREEVSVFGEFEKKKK